MMNLHSSETEGQGSERRKYGRYRLVMPVVGHIEHNLLRYSGRVVDVSAGGFRLFVPGENGAGLAFPGTADFGEIAIDGRLIGGFGYGVFVKATGSGVFVGFHWDECVFVAHQQTLSSIIDYLVEQKNAGCAVICDSRIVIQGHASVALTSDIFGAVDKGIKRISMQGCTSIDSGGLDLLIGLQECGVFVEDCSAEISDVLDRFHLRVA